MRISVDGVSSVPPCRTSKNTGLLLKVFEFIPKSITNSTNVNINIICILDAPSKNNKSTNVFDGSNSFKCFKKHSETYFASFFLPKLNYGAESFTSRTTGGLLAGEPTTFSNGILLIVAKSPSIAKPNVFASLKQLFTLLLKITL